MNRPILSASVSAQAASGASPSQPSVLLADASSVSRATGEIEVRTVSVQHVTIHSRHSFEEVRAKLEGMLPKLDSRLLEVNEAEGPQTVLQRLEKSAPLSIFSVRDHGRLLRSLGLPGQALQYEIGNPLTASKMSRIRSSAALYAPIRVILRAEPGGTAAFEYDSPASVFGQFHDGGIDVVAQALDKKLKDVLIAAAS